jgi:uncharacterized protein involved in exopolysaccharide biosynthesis
MLLTVPTALPQYNLTEDRLSSNEPDSVDADAIIRFIRKSWRLCLIWIFAGLGACIAFIILSPGYYTAVAVILLEDRISTPPAGLVGGQAAVDPAYADSQIQILQSDEVIGRVVDQNRITEVEEFGKAGDGLTASISRFASLLSPERPAATEPTTRHVTIMHFRRALLIRQVGISNAVEIGFTSKNPVRSAAIANAIAQTYIVNQVDQKRKDREDAASRLMESLAELRDKAFAIDPPAQDSSLATPETGEQALARSRELQNRTESYRILYDSLLQRRYTESVDQFSFPAARVITRADPPVERSWPRAILLLAIGFACSAAGGIGHSLLRQVTDHSLRTVEDVQRSTSLDHVTGIPKIKRRSWKTGKFRQKGLQPAYVRGSASFYDATVRLAVRLQGGQGNRSGLIIGVVAPTAGAGASLVAAHLARIIAESGQKTLLIDANWRKPSIDQALLEPNPGRGLASRLATINSEPESLIVLMLRPMAAISELNASLSIATAFQQLQSKYDCVVVDFHSTEHTADFEANMTAINEVIVVAEARRTSSETLLGFLRLIPSAKIAAVILNKV